MRIRYADALLLMFLLSGLFFFTVVDSCEEACVEDDDCGVCSRQNKCCICAPHWNTSEMGCRPSCERIHSKYVGYPECSDRLRWLYNNWDHVAWTQLYIDNDVTGTVCSCQRFLSSEIREGNIEHHCPDPDWVDHSNDQIVNKDGSITFLIYRALRSHVWGDLNTKDKWAPRLHNANAASLGGVLGYLHTEVVPDDMREQEDIANNMRKWDYDGIMLFNVTIKTPPHITQKYGNMMGPFTAFDAGRCTGGPDVCDFENGLKAFAPGRQEQSGNPRHKYSNAWWYSFPQCGFCEWPTGEPDCTFTYNVVGLYKIDDMVFPHFCEGCNPGTTGPCKESNNKCRWWETDTKEGKNCAEGVAECPKDSFRSWSEEGKKEYVRNRPIANVDDCIHLGGYAATVDGLDFWYYVCEERMCDDRMQLLDGLPLDKSWAQPGIAPDPWTCIAGYTYEPGMVQYDPESSGFTSQTIPSEECNQLCTEDFDCEAWSWQWGNDECRIYKYGSLVLRTPTYWAGNFYHRNQRPAPTPPPTPPPPTEAPISSPTSFPTFSPLKGGLTYPPSTGSPTTQAPTTVSEGKKADGNVSFTNANNVLWIFVAVLAAVAMVAVGLFVVCRIRAKKDDENRHMLLQEDRTGDYEPPNME